MPLWAFGALLVAIGALAGGLALGLPLGAVPIPTPPASVAPVATASPSQAPPTASALSAPEPPPDMVLVPAGLFTLGANDDPNTAPAHKVNLAAPFFIERTEVTNQAYRACVAAGACKQPRQLNSLTHQHYYDSPDFDRYPVIYVTWQDARAYCAWHGRRLPTEAEWERAARGDDGRRYPWGNEWEPQRVQLSGDDLGGDMAAVGSFPQNASPYGALDMAGNAWEWTSSRAMAYPYAAGDGREVVKIGGTRVVRGGAWGTYEYRARTTTRDGKNPEDAFWNRGLRCAADAAGPTRNVIPAGLAQPPAGMVAVPGGLLRMGTSQAEGERWVRDYGWLLPVGEFPQHSVTLAPFFLDRTEVTNQQYDAFIKATGHAPPANPFNPETLNIWRNGAYPAALAQYPVVNVTWQDARDYCAWSDKRLPTEAEWEWAARGPEGWLWPWGNDFDQARVNTKERGLEGAAPADGDSAGASWAGALGMGGNVWEWTASLGLPYPYDPTDGREDPARPGARATRGGSWLDSASGAHTSGRNQFDAALANVNLGFRCAK